MQRKITLNHSEKLMNDILPTTTAERRLPTTTAELLLRDLGQPTLTLTDTAERRIREANAEASKVLIVSDDSTRDAAIDALQLVSKVVSDMESSRASIKRPVIDIGKMIDEVVKDSLAPLKFAKDRLSKLVGEYEAKVRAKAAEVARREKEERDRIAREAVTKQLSAKTAEEHAQAAKEATSATIQSHERAIEAQSTAKEGTRVVQDWEFDVTNIEALFRAFPGAVELKPRKSEIKKLLKEHDGVLPGVEARPVAKASISARPRR